jgi:16S rRNA (guanine527-N7)-methyltransferase
MEEFDMLADQTAQLFGLTLSPSQLENLARYADLLVEWNQKINLTAIRSAEEIRIKHFLDSLSCHLAFEGTDVAKMIDIGTGAGFPGIPLKIIYPEMQLTLVESVTKKTQFLSEVVQVLGLEDVEIHPSRAENMGKQPDHRESYSWAVARAVAGLPVLCEYLLPLVKIGGFMLAQKGETALAELEQAQPAIELLGGKSVQTIPVELPGVTQQRYLVIIEKVSPTPEKYPRRVGIPSKRPIGF